MEGNQDKIKECHDLGNELFELGRKQRLEELKGLDINSVKAKELIKQQKLSDKNRAHFHIGIIMAKGLSEFKINEIELPNIN